MKEQSPYEKESSEKASPFHYFRKMMVQKENCRPLEQDDPSRKMNIAS